MNLNEAKSQDTEIYCPDCLVECEWAGYTEWYECPKCGDTVALTKSWTEQIRKDNNMDSLDK